MYGKTIEERKFPLTYAIQHRSEATESACGTMIHSSVITR